MKYNKTIQFSSLRLHSRAFFRQRGQKSKVMCGILAVFGCIDNSQAKRSRIIELSRRLRHRGPDWSGLHCHKDCYLAHQRLAIVDPASGDQPLYNEEKRVIVTVGLEGGITHPGSSSRFLPHHMFPWFYLQLLRRL